jgi:hypothetical protein
VSKRKFAQHTSVLQEISTDPTILLIVTPHARDQMLERGIDLLDVRATIATGRVVGVSSDVRGEAWIVRGKPLDNGRVLAVVLTVDSLLREVAVVTVYWP